MIFLYKYILKQKSHFY